MMVEQPARLLVVVGSVRVGRFGPTVGRWFVDQATTRPDLSVTVVDLADLALPNDLSGGSAAEEWTQIVDRADGIVFVTPEYNHGYPGGVKTAIDTIAGEWRAKAIGFVSYGGMAGGMRCVQQLKTIFTELRAVVLRESVSFTWVWEQFDSDGELIAPEQANRSASTLLDEMAWWCEVLRAARNEPTTGRDVAAVLDA